MVVEDQTGQRLIEVVQVQRAATHERHGGGVLYLAVGPEQHSRVAVDEDAVVAAVAPRDGQITGANGGDCGTVGSGSVQHRATGVDEGAAGVGVAGAGDEDIVGGSLCAATVVTLDDQRHRATAIVHDVRAYVDVAITRVIPLAVEPC